MSRQRTLAVTSLVVMLAVFGGCSKRRRSGGNVPPPPNPDVLSIQSVSPSTGIDTGATTVTISGQHFSLATNMTILFGGTPATNISVSSSTSLTCVTPAHAAGVVQVTANILSPSETFTLNNAYVYTTTGGGGGGGGLPMTITSVVPNNGPSVGGTIVTISGSNFAQIASVTFGGSSATIQAVSAGQLQVQTTFHAPGSVAVVVSSFTNGVVTANNAYTFNGSSTGTLTVTNVLPNHGPLSGGNLIEIDGTSFIGSMSAEFSGTAATAIMATSTTTQLFVVVPAAPPAPFSGGPVSLKVKSSDPTAGEITLLGYTYDGAGGAPTLTSINPTTAPESGGTRVTIQGTNFLQGLNSNVSQVLFGNRQLLNLQVVNSTQLTGTLPPAFAGQVSVVAFGTTGQPSNALSFTFAPSLFVTSINPNQGPTAGGGKSVTIKGRNFSANNIASITFAGVAVPANQISVIDSFTITVIPPAAPLLQAAPPVPLTGPVNVVLTGTGIASATFVNGYNYGPTFNSPSVSIEPGSQRNPPAAGTILAAQFLTSQPTGAVVIQQDRCFAYFSLSQAATDVAVIGTGGATNLVDVAVADMNGDSRLDVITLDAAGQIRVTINNNNTSFGPTITTAVPSGTPFSMAVGLINGPSNTNDGFYDVAVVTRSPDQLIIFQGGAGGTLTPLAPIALPVGSSPGQVLCADASKTTKDPKQVRDAHDFGMPQGLDMNGDGKADLVVAFSGTDQVAVLTQTPATPFDFTISSTAYVGTGCVTPRFLALGDLDDSGSLDIVCGNTGTNNLSVFTGNGAGAIAFVGSYALFSPGNPIITSVLVGDYNRDCRQDIVTSSFNGENISIFLGQGNATFADATNYDSQTAPRRAGAQIQSISYDPSFTSVYCLDKNQGSANTDFVTVVTRATILFVQGAIVVPPYATLGAGNDPQAIAFGDLNKDGHRDIVVANRAAGNIQVFINDGLGNFTQFAPIATGQQPESIAIADVNNDGLPDVLVACNGSDAVFLHLNLGGGQIASGTAVSVGARGPHQVLAVDMDGDSNIDIVTVNQYANSISILLNLGNGTFAPALGFSPVGQPQGVYPVGNAPLGIAVGDFNNDGLLDIVTANSSDNTVTVLIRGPAIAGVTSVAIASATDFALGGVIAPEPAAAAGTAPAVISVVEPVAVAIADLNVDGFLDIVTADKFTSTVTILHGGKGGVGTNFFVPTDYGHFGAGAQPVVGQPPVKINLPPNSNPIAVQLVDMNDDGTLDIAVGCFGGSSVIDFITQGRKTQLAATGPTDLNRSTPSNTQVPAGETAFVFDKAKLQILYASGQPVTFSGAVGSNVTAMAIARLTPDCPPVVGTTSVDKKVNLFKVK